MLQALNYTFSPSLYARNTTFLFDSFQRRVCVRDEYAEKGQQVFYHMAGRTGGERSLPPPPPVLCRTLTQQTHGLSSSALRLRHVAHRYNYLQVLYALISPTLTQNSPHPFPRPMEKKAFVKLSLRAHFRQRLSLTVRSAASAHTLSGSL